MKMLQRIWVLAVMVCFAACTEDIVIDVEEGDPMVGVEASFTDELKQHEAVLSYTAEFYNQNEIQMLSGATVYVTDGMDTVYYFEDAEQAPMPLMHTSDTWDAMKAYISKSVMGILD